MLSSVDLGLGLLHIATGAFFTVTGYRKVFKPGVRVNVINMLTKQGVSYALAVATLYGELLGGLGLLSGAFTHLAALGLIPIMLGAYRFGAWPGVWKKQTSPLCWSQLCSNALCTPEAQLLIIVATLALTGAGPISLDALIWS